MSFGFSPSDVILVTQLAWKTVQNSRKACGAYDELTREVSSCHAVLQKLHRELENTESLLNKKKDEQEELEIILAGCKNVLRVLDIILEKYNVLSHEERSGRKLWQKIRFGNGKVEDVRDQRAQLTYHTQALSLYINLHTVGSVGRVERQMKDSGGDLRALRVAVNDITAHLLSTSNDHHDGSILSNYTDDDRAVWKEFRRELIQDGFRSSVIKRHKHTIKAYIEELGNRGLFDEGEPIAMNICDEESLRDVESDSSAMTAEATGVLDMGFANSSGQDMSDDNVEDVSNQSSAAIATANDMGRIQLDDFHGNGIQNSSSIDHPTETATLDLPQVSDNVEVGETVAGTGRARALQGPEPFRTVHDHQQEPAHRHLVYNKETWQDSEDPDTRKWPRNIFSKPVSPQIRFPLSQQDKIITKTKKWHRDRSSKTVSPRTTFGLPRKKPVYRRLRQDEASKTSPAE